MSSIFYVYIHRKPTGEIFYVGKGKNQRAFDKWGRSEHWQSIVNKYGYEVEILYSNLTEVEAFDKETSTIGILKPIRQGGTLVNQTDGGVGAKGVYTTESTRKLKSERTKGNKHPNADKTIYTFLHFYTREEFTGTRQDFTICNGLRVDDLFLRKNPKTNIRGWCLKENAEKIERTKQDIRIHTFEHITGRVVQSTREGFREITGVDTVKLFANPPHRRNSVKGWCLGGNFDKIRLKSSLTQVYTFININGNTITATRSNFKKQTGIEAASLFRLGDNRRNSVQGWCLEEKLAKLRIVAHPSQVYTFMNTDGVVIKSTRSEFKVKTGVDTKALFRKSKECKTAHGWRLKPTEAEQSQTPSD